MSNSIPGVVPELVSSAYSFDDTKENKYVEYPQLLCVVYKLDNGIVYKWEKRNLYEDYQIHIVRDMGSRGCGCGNPWNTIGDYRDQVVSTKPKSEKVFEQNSGMYHKLLSSSFETKEYMKELINGDMWCIYTITEDRTRVIKTYFDFRMTDWKEDPEGEAVRNKPASDPSDLIKDIDNGNTVVFVFGSSEFIETYFIRVSQRDIMAIEVTHD